MNRTEKLLEQLIERLDVLIQSKNTQCPDDTQRDYTTPKPKDFWGIPRCGYYITQNGVKTFVQGYGD